MITLQNFMFVLLAMVKMFCAIGLPSLVATVILFTDFSKVKKAMARAILTAIK